MNTLEVINQFGDEYSLPPRFTRIGCRAIIVENGKILLSHEVNTGVYLTPGGGLESAETNADCVVREVLEETGYLVKVVSPFVIVDEYYYDKLFVSNYFICETAGKEKQSLTETEILHGVTPEWVGLEKALEIFGTYEDIIDEELAAQYKREFTVLNKYRSLQELYNET